MSKCPCAFCRAFFGAICPSRKTTIAMDEEENWITINGANVRLDENGNLKGDVGNKIEEESEKVARQRSNDVKEAYRKIERGESEVVIAGLRKDLEALGGTSDVTLFKGNKKYGLEHIKARGRENDIEGILEAVANGKVMNPDNIATNKIVYVQKDGYEALLSLDYKGTVKTWLLTGYRIDESTKPRKDRG